MQLEFDFLIGLPDIDPERVGLYGWSLGVADVLLHTASNRRVGAVMDDREFARAPYSSASGGVG